jgi:hypothetical protein
MTIASAPLTNSIDCGGNYFASSGKLVSISPNLVAGLATTVLDVRDCWYTPGDPNLISNALLVKSATSATIYYIDPVTGVKRGVNSVATLLQITAPAAPRVFVVSTVFLNSVPTGSDYLSPGTLVKSPVSPTVYLVNDTGNFVPVRSFSTITDMGLSTATRVIPAAVIASATIAPSVLSNIVSCGGVDWIAAQGKRWQLPAASVGTLPVTPLSAAACATIPTTPTVLGNPTFIKSSAAMIYNLNNGLKQGVGSFATLARLANGSPMVWLTINQSFIDSIPNATPVTIP